MLYQVKLNVFEGPYDLLLFLIRKNELDIYDVPISKIAKEYLEYIAAMRLLDINIAGEFLVVASTLMRIKAKSMLPVYVDEVDDVDILENEIWHNVLEYEKIRLAAIKISEHETEGRKLFMRGKYEELEAFESSDEVLEMQMNVYELIRAYHETLAEKPPENFHHVTFEPYTIEEQMDAIMVKLSEVGKISFKEHFQTISEKIVVVINFLALLELARKRLIKLGQTKTFKDIWIYKTENNV